MQTIEDRVFEIHDVDVNQKYGGALNLPYSFHLKMVLKQRERFFHLLNNHTEDVLTYYGCLGHDLGEDARLTYNDIIELFQEGVLKSTAIEVADIVYLVTDFKGKTRAERKPQQYYDELKTNKLALFVKLCDMIANKYFSAMINSSMLKKYQQEFVKFKEELYLEEYKEMFDHLENIK